MKAFTFFLVLGVVLYGAFAVQADYLPIGVVPVVDNSGVSLGYIPPIANVEKLMDNRKIWAVFSPDGQFLAFPGPQRSNIYLVPADGGIPVQIFKISAVTGITQFMNEIRFTPDGKEITFVRWARDSKTGNTSYFIESANIATGKNRVIVNNGNFPNWSYDGRYLCYINIDPKAYTDPANAQHHYAPAILDTQTGQTRFLTDENFNQTPTSNPYLYTAFSPDGTHIVTSKNIDGKKQIVKIPFTGGAPEQMTFFGDNVFLYQGNDRTVYNPLYSPDGKWLVFTVDNTMVIMDTATRKVYNIFSRKPFEACTDLVDTPLFKIQLAWPGSWSADGKKLVYSNYVVWDKLNDTVPIGSKVGANNWYTVIYDFEPKEYGTPSLTAETLPVDFAITGNFPNPFNPSTTITFSLPVSGQAGLAVYSVTGQKIRELVSGTLPAGVHSVVWDGRDQNGVSVSSGVYISRLTMRDKVTTNRMLLVK